MSFFNQWFENSQKVANEEIQDVYDEFFEQSRTVGNGNDYSITSAGYKNRKTRTKN